MKLSSQLLVLEASRWVGVKEVGGNNHGELVTLFQKAVDGKASGESWCFIGSTEILTEDGWQPFSELDPLAKVAQVDSRGGLSFIKPTQYIEKDHCEEGYRLSNRSFDIVCDKGHRFWGYFNNSPNLEFGTLDRLTTGLSVPSCSTLSKGNKNLSDSELDFLAAFLSDGFYSKTRQGKPRIKIQVSKPRKIELLRSFAPVGEHTDSKTYGRSNIPLTTFTFTKPEIFDNIFSEYKELDWGFVFSLNKSQARRFLDSYSQFDGHIKDGSIRLFSSRKELADQLLTLALLSGFHPSMNSVISELSGRPCYEVRWSPEKETRSFRPDHVSKVKLDEKLYCVEVPEGRIVVRGTSDSAPLVVGNCMAFVQYCVKHTQNVLDLMPGNIEKEILPAGEHCLTVWNATKPQYKSQFPSLGSIVIWRRGTTTNGHTGIVIGPTGSTFQTIEGNTGAGAGVISDGDGVYKRERALAGNGDMKVVGFINPWG